ncbi:GNAT family N-acetyltransferase [Arthrobacter sp. G119Y2]|uniref:GNAT family N-acetyltransferase n=1 Tax=Arthrobacter sp. G119Y2 TaxID=3134965 RepID=UPI0031193487
MTLTPDDTASAAERPTPATGLPAGLSTDRLRLSPITTAELDALIIQSRLPDWAPDFPQPTDHDAARQFFEAGLNTVEDALSTRLIRENATGQVVGTIGFLLLPEDGDVEVSYSVVPSRRGQGYATEALTALARHALDQAAVSRVIAYTEPENAASQALLLTAGFLPVETPGLGLGFILQAAQLPEANE